MKQWTVSVVGTVIVAVTFALAGCGGHSGAKGEKGTTPKAQSQNEPIDSELQQHMKMYQDIKKSELEQQQKIRQDEKKQLKEFQKMRQESLRREIEFQEKVRKGTNHFGTKKTEQGATDSQNQDQGQSKNKKSDSKNTGSSS
ncbi:hypothetical protein ACFQI7_18975 [Paenibacillus allorhizosphaerae]|uniref:Lipoprotein n=1 Tax=Paenibacillus allorhizosphaerae TaxID=2849866 RepID=A0ABN7TXX5_9BACL|nr:hypothetical protein [Paenibacillus allorhizosphaerae]CAG7656529.1 hypothetical protein PAECIP111802_06443 [Paenibacillus allorhizosphaerae]